MSINDLVKIKKKIELLEKYLGMIQELQGNHLSQADNSLLSNYSKLLGINLKYERQDLELIKEGIVQTAQNATGYYQLSDAEKLFIQELEASATPEELAERDKLIAKLELTEQRMTEQYKEAKTEIITAIKELDDALDEVMYETFMNVEDIKKKI